MLVLDVYRLGLVQSSLWHILLCLLLLWKYLLSSEYVFITSCDSRIWIILVLLSKHWGSYICQISTSSTICNLLDIDGLLLCWFIHSFITCHMSEIAGWLLIFGSQIRNIYRFVNINHVSLLFLHKLLQMSSDLHLLSWFLLKHLSVYLMSFTTSRVGIDWGYLDLLRSIVDWLEVLG